LPPPDVEPPRRNLLRSAEFRLGVIVGGSAIFVGFGLFGFRAAGALPAPSPAITGRPAAPTLTLTAIATPTPTPTRRPTPNPTPSPTRPPTPPPTPTPTPSPTPLPTPQPTPLPTEGPESHLDPELEARLPDTIGGTPLHRTSPGIADQLRSDPRAANALNLLRFIGKGPDDIHFARAMDDADPNRFTELAFQIRGLDARIFGGVIVGVVTSQVPGAQTTTLTLGGKTVTKAVNPAGGPSAYLYETGDTAFAIQTTDENLATEALTRLP
jgi:hypothetical protein